MESINVKVFANNPCNIWVAKTIKHSSYTQAEVAAKIGITRNTVSLWMNGVQRVPLVRMVEIAKLCGADPLYARNIYFKEQLGETMWETDERIRMLDSITANELEFIELLRQYGNPKLDEESRDTFIRLLESIQKN